MKVCLSQLSFDNGAAEYEMLQSIDKEENGFTNAVNGMSYDEYRSWLLQQEDYSKAINLPENYIPQTTFFLYINDVPVGLARIRHYSSPILEKKGVGAFGYGIAREHRGKGYGSILYREIMKKCCDMGYDRVRSFVHQDNIASNRVFVKNGARLTGLLDDGSIIKNIYEAKCSHFCC